MAFHWKIFRIISVLNWILLFPVLSYACFHYFTRLIGTGPALFHFFFYISMSILFSFLVNSIYQFLSLKNILDPSIQPNSGNSISISLLILTLAGLILLLAFTVYGTNEEFFNKPQNYTAADRTGTFVLIYFFLVLVFNSYIVAKQIQLMKIRSAKKKAGLGSVIESIGQLEP